MGGSEGAGEIDEQRRGLLGGGLGVSGDKGCWARAGTAGSGGSPQKEGALAAGLPGGAPGSGAAAGEDVQLRQLPEGTRGGSSGARGVTERQKLKRKTKTWSHLQLERRLVGGERR